MLYSQTIDGLSRSIADHVDGLNFDRLPDGTVAATRRALLDSIAVMFAATGLAADAHPYRALAIASPGESRLFGSVARAAPVAAALANGALGHALDYGDAFDAGPAHPNAALVPALLALVDSEPTIDVGRFLTAMAAGSDLACRLSIAAARPYEQGGWYPPPLVGVIAAAAACAKLLDLGADGIRHAMGLALLSAAFPAELKYDTRSLLRGVREAFVARAAVEAALLVRAGATAFEAPLEGRAAFFELFGGGRPTADLTAALGTRFLGDEVSFKPWPCCRGTHAYIEAALLLRDRVDWRRVTRIIAEIGPIQEMLIRPHAAKVAPGSAIEAKFSIPYCTAAALVTGAVSLDSFTDAAQCDPEVLSLAARVVEYRNPAWDRSHAASGSIIIETEDGQRLEQRVVRAAGSPEAPLADAALVDKFADCLGRASLPLGAVAARAAAHRILTLPAGEAATALLDMLFPTSYSA